RIRRGHHSRLRNSLVFDQHAFQLERADPIVTGLEDVVRTPHIREVAIGIAPRHVTGVVEAARHHLGGPRVVVTVADHEPERTVVQVQTDLALVADRAGSGVDQCHGETRQWPSHGTRPDLLTGCVRHLYGGFGLAETVADRDTPGLADLFDDLRVERLARADHLPRGRGEFGDVGLDQHPPHGRWGAEAGDTASLHVPEQGLGVEPGVVVDEHAGTGIPRREHVTPRVFRPAGRGDVQVDI